MNECDFAHANMKNIAACGLRPAACAAPSAAAFAAAYVVCWALRQVCRGGRAQQANSSANHRRTLDFRFGQAFTSYNTNIIISINKITLEYQQRLQDFGSGGTSDKFIHEFLSSPVLQWRHQNFVRGGHSIKMHSSKNFEIFEIF